MPSNDKPKVNNTSQIKNKLRRSETFHKLKIQKAKEKKKEREKRKREAEEDGVDGEVN